MKSSRRKLDLSIDRLMVLLLFLFSLDFLDLSGAIIALTILLCIFFKFTTIKIDKNCGLLVLFSLMYFGSVAFFEGFSLDHLIKFAIAPWGCYIIGYNFDTKEDSISVTKLAAIMALGFFMHGMLNLISSIQVFGAGFNNNYRLAYDFWQKRQISVSTAALYYSPLALMCIGGAFFARSKIIKMLSVVSIFLSLYATLIYQNRTLILAVGVVILTNIIIIIRDNGLTTKRKLWLFASIFVAILLFILIWTTNMWGIRRFLEGTNLFYRLTGGDQDRTKIWASFIFGEAWKYPFGGTKAILYNNKPYVHNLWLDTFRRTGFLPFILLIAFTVKGIKDSVTFIKHQNMNVMENTRILASLLFGTLFLFFTEPIIEANPYLFYFPIIIIGMICRSNRGYRTREEN